MLGAKLCFVALFLVLVSSSVDVDKDVNLVLIGMRHAERNPAQFLKDDPNKGKWGLEGEAQLNDIGRRQAAAIGEMLKARYSFIPEDFHKDDMKGYSSSAERCQETLQGVLNEVYLPTKVYGGKILPQAVPYSIDNPLLRMYAIDCPEGDKGWQPISDDNLPGLQKMINDNKELIEFLELKTGWNGSLSNVADVADNLKTMKALGLEYPAWVTEHNLKPEGSLFDRIVQFSEAHQLACAAYEPCGTMMAGYWLHHTIEKLKKKEAGDLKPKLLLYASHCEIVLSMMKLMNIDQDILETSGGFLIEYKDKPKPSVRLLTHDPVHGNPGSREVGVASLTKSCGKGGWCPLGQFISSVESKAFNDWEDECGIPDKECPELKGKAILDCSKLTDKHRHCKAWASQGFCEKTDSRIKYVLCQKSCLCSGDW